MYCVPDLRDQICTVFIGAGIFALGENYNKYYGKLRRPKTQFTTTPQERICRCLADKNSNANIIRFEKFEKKRSNTTLLLKILFV